jgi:hypothetical protein
VANNPPVLKSLCPCCPLNSFRSFCPRGQIGVRGGGASSVMRRWESLLLHHHRRRLLNASMLRRLDNHTQER